MESIFLFNFIVNNACGETENDTFFNWYFKVSDLLIHYHNFISSAWSHIAWASHKCSLVPASLSQ